MGRLLAIFATALIVSVQAVAQVVSDAALRDDVASVALFRDGAPLEQPLLVVGQGGRLLLEFDVLRPEAENLHWSIRHCDRHWQPDGLEPDRFMTGFAEGVIDNYDFSFGTRVDYVHYRAELAGGFSRYTYSGNYVAEVTGADGEPLLTRRFCVSEQSAKLVATVVQPSDGQARDARQELEVVVDGGGMRLDERHLTLTAQQNGRLDNMRELRLGGFDRGLPAYRQRAENRFWAGNTFRYFDCSNLHSSMYNVASYDDLGGWLFARLRPEADRSRRPFSADKTLAGGMKVNVWDRQRPALEADYVRVEFTLPMAQPLLAGDVYVVGELTQWRLDSTSRMEYDPQRRLYTLTLMLKQGYYAYQLLVRGSGSDPLSHSATAALEGDHWEAPNEYTLRLYQHSPTDAADRLLAVHRVAAGAR